MLKKYLKRKILTFSSRYLNETLAASTLSPLILGGTYIPITRWAASFCAIAHVANDIIINRRTSLIEFGSGASTILLARLFRMNNIDASFVSVESDANWIETQEKNLERDGLEGIVTFIHAPVVEGSLHYKNNNRWFCSDTLQKNLGDKMFDVIFADAPKGDVPYARHGAGAFLRDKLHKSFCLFLDDTNRPDEYELLCEWHKMFPGSQITFCDAYGFISSGDCYDATPLQLKYTAEC